VKIEDNPEEKIALGFCLLAFGFWLLAGQGEKTNTQSSHAR
jgi:hypothetical protein